MKPSRGGANGARAGGKEGERPLGLNLAMIGVLGWTIVAPTLLGVFAGRWLDHRFASGIFWTLGLLVAGLALGCTLAWKKNLPRMTHDAFLRSPGSLWRWRAPDSSLGASILPPCVEPQWG
ncbi:AtpZ/AtpI family protein (plasmid) [Methylocystis rosea]|uniref:AtpZ/AtpI family protein n=1 Tax=Methylocystis rosea TaxID=173366 RepID=A0ABX6ELK9_9HYPH|nr:AtpZ/AtpI family protein [Methylocystis rosea]QGM95712.1 AtpZ/AtpI family protein [Methylocystis rosea]